MENLNLGNFYELVRKGDWTHDKMFEYAKSAVRDLDGDGKITEADKLGDIVRNQWAVFYI